MRERTVGLAVWVGIAAVLIGVVGVGVWSLMRPATPRQISVLQGGGAFGKVPDFTLIERSGRPLSLGDLAGRYWVADFIFTRCAGVCPLLTTRMASLIQALSEQPGGAEMRFVSFSVDPDWDTPAVLSHHAASLGIVDPRWMFVTGARGDLYRLIGEGFKLSVAQNQAAGAAAGDLITHSDRFVLVDPKGVIRGYYHGDEEGTVASLTHDLERLREAP